MTVLVLKCVTFYRYNLKCIKIVNTSPQTILLMILWIKLINITHSKINLTI